MNNRVVPFLLGIALGHFGLRWFMHAGYMAAIVAAYFIGKHVGSI